MNPVLGTVLGVLAAIILMLCVGIQLVLLWSLIVEGI